MARLNEMIRSRRKELGLTLLQLAEKTGVREATVQRWESGNIKTIKYETMELLAHALNCTPQYLMGWEEEKTPAPESGLSEARRALLDAVEGMSEEEIFHLIDVIAAVKGMRK